LASAQTVATSGQYCWGQAVPPWSGDPSSQGYDRYGNLLKINSSQCTSPTLNLSVNTYNQITNSGFTYDAAGNMTADGVASYVWNGTGLLKSVGTTTYTYDGDGKRVMNSAGTYYWTTPSGEQLSDTPGAGAGNEYIFFAGQRIAWVDSAGTVRYYFGDHLGTSRIVTDAAGNVCYDADYYPFQGARTPYVSNCTPAYKMAGMKFDQESGNYYTLNRYYPPNLGRWLSPDPLAGDITNPQSLNRYAYVLNNPTTLTDPTGLRAPWPLSAPACPDWWSCHGLGASGGGGGGAIWGNDIFDAISGAPGAYLTQDMYGNMGFGFSIDLWRQTNSVIDVGRQISVAEGYDPAQIPTTGYTVVERDLGTPDINTQYAASGLVPDIQRVEEERRWLVAQLPTGYQRYYNSWLQLQGPWGALNRTFNVMATRDPTTFASLAPYMNGAQTLYTRVDIRLLGFWGMLD
jgi:RHS repeat-associated protein